MRLFWLPLLDAGLQSQLAWHADGMKSQFLSRLVSYWCLAIVLVNSTCLSAVESDDHLEPFLLEVVSEKYYSVSTGERNLVSTATYAKEQDGLLLRKVIVDPSGGKRGEVLYRRFAGRYLVIRESSNGSADAVDEVVTERDDSGRPVKLVVGTVDGNGKRLSDEARNTYVFEYDEQGRLAKGPIFGHIFTYEYSPGEIVATALKTKTYRTRLSEKKGSDGKGTVKRKVVEEQYADHHFIYSMVETDSFYRDDGVLERELTAGIYSTFSRDRLADETSRGLRVVNENSQFIYSNKRLTAILTDTYWAQSYPHDRGMTSGQSRTEVEYRYGGEVEEKTAAIEDQSYADAKVLLKDEIQAIRDVVETRSPGLFSPPRTAAQEILATVASFRYVDHSVDRLTRLADLSSAMHKSPDLENKKRYVEYERSRIRESFVAARKRIVAEKDRRQEDAKAVTHYQSCVTMIDEWLSKHP